MGQSSVVGGAQNYTGRLACFECLLPTGCTQTPTVAGLQAWKTELRHWCRKIVAARLGKVEKRGSHHGADRVATNILLSSIAAPVPIKPRHGGNGANIERVAKHVAGCTAPTASIATVVPQHCRLLLAPGPGHNPAQPWHQCAGGGAVHSIKSRRRRQ